MTTPVTFDHEQRAFELLRRPDWPATLAELLTAARQAALVHGLAQRLANGQGMTLPPHPTALADQPPPCPVPLRAWDFPARRTGLNPNAPHRRRTDGVDGKSLAAGERSDD